MRVHFIGIGGIGVSALARYYLAKGHQVSGSDLVSTEITDALGKKGAKIYIGHKISKLKTQNLPDLVVYSPAVSKTNPELKNALELQVSGFKLQVLSYPQALGELTKKYFTIAVCGSHGKSTVVAMLGLILTRAGFDPTVIVGTMLKEFGDPAPHQTKGFGAGSNFRMGKSPYLVIEADEHFSSFLNYWPKIVVLTNLEPDHLDYYKNFKNYILAFKKFISHLPKGGILAANKDDRNISKLKTFTPPNFQRKLGRARNSKIQPRTQSYSLKQGEAKKLRKILKVPGEFNVANALAALTAARTLKIPDEVSFKALSEYRGSWRRFEEKDLKIKNLTPHQNKFGTGQEFKIISDYAHHPTQIQATLGAAREKYPKRKIWCIFQPHQHQRTYYLFDDFVNVFSKSKVDKLIITDIYDVAGREDKAIKRKVSSEKLVNKIKIKNSKFKNSIMHIPSIQETGEYLKRNLRGGEVVIIMGAGDIYAAQKKWRTGRTRKNVVN